MEQPISSSVQANSITQDANELFSLNGSPALLATTTSTDLFDFLVVPLKEGKESEEIKFQREIHPNNKSTVQDDRQIDE